MRKSKIIRNKLRRDKWEKTKPDKIEISREERSKIRERLNFNFELPRL